MNFAKQVPEPCEASGELCEVSGQLCEASAELYEATLIFSKDPLKDFFIFLSQLLCAYRAAA
jgi:hypothetical protein